MAAAVSGLNLSAQFRYGPMVGVTVTDLKFKQDLISIDKSVGFSAGVATELMFPGIGFGVDAGLFYEQRGATLDLGQREVWGFARLWQGAFLSALS